MAKVEAVYYCFSKFPVPLLDGHRTQQHPWAGALLSPARPCPCQGAGSLLTSTCLLVITIFIATRKWNNNGNHRQGTSLAEGGCSFCCVGWDRVGPWSIFLGLVLPLLKSLMKCWLSLLRHCLKVTSSPSPGECSTAGPEVTA